MTVLERVSIGSIAQGAVPPGYTFTRSTNATFFDSDGLLKWAPNNMALNSQDFANAGWNKRGTTTVTSDSATAPDGTATADRISNLGAGSGTSQGLDSNFSLGTTGTVTVSFYIKRSSTSGTLKLYNIADNTRGEWSIDMALLSDSWERVTATHAAVTVVIPFTASVSSTGGFQWKASSGTLDFDLWGAQISVGSKLFVYLPTTSAPRYGIRRQWDATNRRWGYVGEGSRTNLLAYSEQLDNAAWTKTACTITANSATSPDGTANADTLDSTVAGGRAIGFAVATATSSHAVSVFVKAGTASSVTLLLRNNTTATNLAEANFNLTSGASSALTGAGAVAFEGENFGNGWWRIAVASSGGVTAGNSLALYVYPATSSGTGTSYAWGAQLEAGPAPSSYIPTTTVAVTRSADLLTRALTGPEGTALSTQGTMVVEFSYLGGGSTIDQGSRTALEINNATTAERIRIYNLSGTPTVHVVDGGANQSFQSVTGSPTVNAGVITRVGVSWALNDVSVCVDGSAVATDATATMPTVTTIGIGGYPSSNTQPLFGLIYGWTIYDDAKTDAELQALTTSSIRVSDGPGI